MPETPERLSDEELEKRSSILRERDATGKEWDDLYRLGWRPPSQRKGAQDGLEECEEDCGVCFPTFEMKERVRRQRRRR